MSLSTVLGQEMAKFNILLNCIRKTLKLLQLAIHGIVVMSSDLDMMYTSMLEGQFPRLFKTVSYSSLKPLGSWIVDLIDRVTFIRDWLKHGQPDSFPLYLFFFPQGFLTGVLQTHARKYGIAINILHFKFHIFDPEKEEAVKDGVVIHGLWLEGAGWNAENNLLQESKPGEIYSSLSSVHFEPTA